MSSPKKMITLQSSDKEEFVVEQAVAEQCLTIKHLIEDGCATTAIPVANVTGPILSKVIEYCKTHVDGAPKPSSAASSSTAPPPEDRSAAATTEELKAWDAEFVKVDQATLFDLILAANYLNITSLLDLTCQTVADMIKGNSPEEIRAIFNIKNDFTPEEEEAIRKENQWAFE